MIVGKTNFALTPKLYGQWSIFKNNQPKSYQSSKILTPNEWAQWKKKKEPKIPKNGGEMRENQKEGKMTHFHGFGALSSCINEEEI